MGFPARVGPGARRRPLFNAWRLLLLFPFLPALAGAAKEIQLADPSLLQSAIARADAEGALVALILTRSEGAAGTELAAVLREPEVERALGRTVALLVSADREPSIAERYGVQRFPVVVFIDGSGKEAGRIAGSFNSTTFAARAAEIVGGATPRPARSGTPPALESDPSTLVAAGRRMWNAGERFEAVAHFERALQALSAPAVGRWSGQEAWAATRAHLGLGDHLRGAGRPGEAEPHYRSALSAIVLAEGPPSDLQLERARAAVGLALSARLTGRTAEAAQALAAVLRGTAEAPPLSGPSRERVTFLLGRLLLELGDEERGRERLEECARLFPGGRYGERARRSLSPDRPAPTGSPEGARASL